MAHAIRTAPDDTSIVKVNGFVDTDDRLRTAIATDHLLRFAGNHWLAKALGDTELVDDEGEFHACMRSGESDHTARGSKY